MDLIQQYLPQHLWEQAKTFSIGEEFIKYIPDIIVLILESKSIDTHEEKQSWFDLLPMMNDEQMNKLRDILTREKQKLIEIEKKYEDKKQELQLKYIKKREYMVNTKRIEAIKQKEAEHEQLEDQEAEHLLTQI